MSDQGVINDSFRIALKVLLTTVTVPNRTTPTLALGSRSMMILNVNQMLARANQEKISEKILYCNIQDEFALVWSGLMIGSTYEGLDMQEKHADNAVS